MIPTSLFLFWPQNDDYRNFEAQTSDSGQVPLESKWEGPLWYPGYKCREKKNLNSKTTVTNRWVVPDLTVVDLDQHNNNLQGANWSLRQGDEQVNKRIKQKNIY